MKDDGGASRLPGPPCGGYQGLEFRHLRYLLAVAEAGTFTRAAEQMFVAQPTLSQQVRRLEEILGTPLLQRRRDGVRLTAAGSILLEEARIVLSRLDHGITRSRQAAGLGRPRLRFVLPPNLPEGLAVAIGSRLRAHAEEAGAEVEWLEMPLDVEFSLIKQRRADAGVGWLTSAWEALPDSLDAMTVGEFEPETWLPASTGATAGESISLTDLADLTVIHGPRRAGAAAYDAWQAALRAVRPQFGFSDPPFRHSLPMTLALAATAALPTAVLTGPRHDVTVQNARCVTQHADSYDMVRVSLEKQPLTATAIVAWNADLPRHLQQVLFDTADTPLLQCA
jgi:DNA-binding transcriptional LysR family regulator